MSRSKVVYLTGAPASGKSTLIRGLAKARTDVKVFEYGRAMSEKLSGKQAAQRKVSQEELRGGTEGHVTQADIDELDAHMTTWVHQHRSRKHLIIDSHHVTIERYGFRLAPFSQDKLNALNIDEFWLLVLDNSVTVRRISSDPKGRRMPTPFQADFHTYLQSSLVSQYSVLTGCPLYVFDGSLPESDLVTFVSSRLQ